MTDPQTEARAMPDLPDDDSDFTPDLARKIIELYQAALAAKDARISELDHIANHWLAEHDKLRALLAEKNKALEPFARNVELIPLGAQDHDRLCDYGSQFNGTPTVGQARAARRALEAQGGENG